MKTLTSISMLALLWGIYACGPDKPTKPDDSWKAAFTDTLHHNDTFMRYWNFDFGSWWVYQRTDTNAQIFDTAKVEYRNIDTFYRTAPSLYFSYNVRTRHSNWQIGWEFDYGHDSTKRPHQIYQTSYIDEVSIAGDLAMVRSFYWPIRFYESAHGEIVDTLDFTLYSGKIVDAAHLRSPSGKSLWLGKDVGMVKYQGVDGKTWELIDYHIVKP